MTRWTVRALCVWLLILGLLANTSAGDRPKLVPLPRTGPEDPDLAGFDIMMNRFMLDNEVPGAAVAVARDGWLVYSRGFGYADPTAKTLVMPRARFRIASISKPITAVAILRLVEMGKLKLDDHAFPLLQLDPPAGSEPDPRLKEITIRQLLQHTAGFDRAQSFDPMFRPIVIAKRLNTAPPAGPEQVIRYMLGHKLDFNPGSRYAYSNFGYCVLGRVIEKVSGESYGMFVREQVLKPVHMTDTQLGKTLERAANEVTYVDRRGRTGRAVVGPEPGKQVPLPYGTWYLEAMDAHGGWISSAPDLVRFAAAFSVPDRCPVLKADSVRTMFARPDVRAGRDKNGQPGDSYYGCGWNVRMAENGRTTTWHNGALDGTATLLVRRADGLCWAVLFNVRDNPRGEYLSKLIDPLMHQAADRIQRWPSRDLFKKAG
jgi:N-acyl-D-amino-acid deacylase